MSVPVKIDIKASGPHREHAHGREAAGHDAFAHILGHEMGTAQGRTPARAPQDQKDARGQQENAPPQQKSAHADLTDRGTGEANAAVISEAPPLHLPLGPELIEAAPPPMVAVRTDAGASPRMPVDHESARPLSPTAPTRPSETRGASTVHTVASPAMPVVVEHPVAGKSASKLDGPARANPSAPSMGQTQHTERFAAAHAGTAARLAQATRAPDDATRAHEATPLERSAAQVASAHADHADAAETTPAGHERLPFEADAKTHKPERLRSTLLMWDQANPAGAQEATPVRQHEDAAPQAKPTSPLVGARTEQIQPHDSQTRLPSTKVAHESVAHESVASAPVAHVQSHTESAHTAAPVKGEKAQAPGPSPHAVEPRREAASDSAAANDPATKPAAPTSRPAVPSVAHAAPTPVAPDEPVPATPVVQSAAAPSPRAPEPEPKPTRARSVEAKDSARRAHADDTHPDLEAAILATLSPRPAPVADSAPAPSAPAPTAWAAAPQHDARPHVVPTPTHQAASDPQREVTPQRERKHEDAALPVTAAKTEAPAAAPAFTAHAPTATATPQATGDIPPPAPRLPVEATPLANRIAEDPGLTVAVMPQAARLAIDSPDGDLELHVRVRDGSADISVSGSMAPLFDHRAPEVRAALASEGLGLGHYDLNQQGGQQGNAWQGNGGQQGQWQPPPERHNAPAPGPAPAQTAGMARASTANQPQATAPGHIHVTA